MFGSRWHADMGRLIGKHRTAVWHYDSGRYKPEDSSVYTVIEAAAVERIRKLNALLKSSKSRRIKK